MTTTKEFNLNECVEEFKAIGTDAINTLLCFVTTWGAYLWPNHSGGIVDYKPNPRAVRLVKRATYCDLSDSVRNNRLNRLYKLYIVERVYRTVFGKSLDALLTTPCGQSIENVLELARCFTFKPSENRTGPAINKSFLLSIENDIMAVFNDVTCTTTEFREAINYTFGIASTKTEKTETTLKVTSGMNYLDLFNSLIRVYDLKTLNQVADKVKDYQKAAEIVKAAETEPVNA